MKKILLLILAMIPVVNVSAISTYYSDYRPYKMTTEEVLELDDTLKVESYEEVDYPAQPLQDNTYLGYVLEDQCENKDLNDYRTDSYIRKAVNPNAIWYQSIFIPNGLINKITITTNIQNELSEIEVFNREDQVTINPLNDDLDLSNLIDHNMRTTYTLEKGTSYSFSFEPIEKSKLVIKFQESNKMDGAIRYQYTNGNGYTIKILADEVDIKNEEEIAELKTKVGIMPNTYLPNSYEKVIDTYYACYAKPLEQHSYIKVDDTPTIKTLYNYYKRDKVKISDKQITSSKYDLKDLVTYSTVEDFTVEDNIDYSVNGTYPVKFIFADDFVVVKEVNVNIKNNNKTTTSETKTNTTTTTSTTKKDETTTKVTTTSTITKATTTSTTTKAVTTVPVVTSTKLTTAKSTTTTNKVEANKMNPTYYLDDDEVVEVEPLMGTIEKKETCECDNKKDIIIYKIIIIILLIVILLLYLFDRVFKSKKETL